MSTCPVCESEFEQKNKSRPTTFCGRRCSNIATAGRRAESNRALAKYAPPVCPCGNDVQPPEGQRWVYVTQKKYCSPECRSKYGKKKTRNKDNYVTFTCLVCDREVTRYKKNGALKYCSNMCAAKHTKRVSHVIVRDHDTVLDSGWEALFYGLCKFHKIPIRRFDREEGVEWQDGSWYAPDFLVGTGMVEAPNSLVAVEVKGNEDPYDSHRWDAFRTQTGYRLVVMDQYGIGNLLNVANDFQEILELLSRWANLL